MGGSCQRACMHALNGLDYRVRASQQYIACRCPAQQIRTVQYICRSELSERASVQLINSPAGRYVLLILESAKKQMEHVRVSES
jgi:hypothetical protein